MSSKIGPGFQVFSAQSSKHIQIIIPNASFKSVGNILIYLIHNIQDILIYISLESLIQIMTKCFCSFRRTPLA